jgi:hypothetical protein
MTTALTSERSNERSIRMPGPHVIVPHAVYSVEAARQALGLAANTLPREIRKRRLRVSKRAGRHFILGEWLIEWLKAGELQRKTDV